MHLSGSRRIRLQMALPSGYDHSPNDTHQKPGRAEQGGDEEEDGTSAIEKALEEALHADLRSDGLAHIAEDCKRDEPQARCVDEAPELP